MKLTYKERQDILWALEEQVSRLAEHDSVAADESAARLRKLAAKVKDER
jgi:hypothetical protein